MMRTCAYQPRPTNPDLLAQGGEKQRDLSRSRLR